MYYPQTEMTMTNLLNIAQDLSEEGLFRICTSLAMHKIKQNKKVNLVKN